MGEIKKVTKQGSAFIKKFADSGTDNLVKGSNGVFTYGVGVDDKKIWTANSVDSSGKLIKTNAHLQMAIINYYEYYCNKYNLDPNILLAQVYREGQFKLFSYGYYSLGGSSASGIQQFISKTLFDVVINNIYGAFNKTEIEKILKNTGLEYKKAVLEDFLYHLSGEQWLAEEKYRVENNLDTYRKGNYDACKRREQLHQNVIDNLDVMIKAQCVYMSKISKKTNNIAASTLFAYNRGSGLARGTYLDTINAAIAFKNNNYIKEGIKYVEFIFAYLGDKNNKFTGKNNFGVSFGYEDKLDLGADYKYDND